MAVSEREVLAELVELLDRRGVLREGLATDLVVLAKARTLLAITAPSAKVSTVVCDTPRCPSRLVFLGDMTEQQADRAALGRLWNVTAGVHRCPACDRERA